MKMNFIKKGFTMSEALIVIVIIGVIAAIVTGVIKPINSQEKGFEVKAQKTTGILEQALIQMITNNSGLDSLEKLNNGVKSISISAVTDSGDFVQLLKSYLVLATQDVDTTNTYFSKAILKYDKTSTNININSFSNFFYLKDGTLIGYKTYSDCTQSETLTTTVENKNAVKTIDNICSSFFIDVNGINKPNKLGSDQYIIPVDIKGLKFAN